MPLSDLKLKRLKKLMNDQGYFNALAIDQRGALKRMLGEETEKKEMEEFKAIVSSKLTLYASAILLDPEYGWEAVQSKDNNCGLLVAYEKTGYDTTEPGRMPSLLPEWSVKRLTEKGADGIKVLLYYDVDEELTINEQKDVFIERIASECHAEEIPFFLEIITYEGSLEDMKGIEFAKVKPRKVIESMKHFSQARFRVDVLKVEVPVNMDFVEGYAEGKTVYTQEEAAGYFQEQSDVGDIPYIFLSAGVTPELFQETLKFAKDASAKFHGVLCGRATWSGAAKAFKEDGNKAATQWLLEEGVENITALNNVLELTATNSGYDM